MSDTETYFITSHLLVGSMPQNLSGIFTWANSVPEAVRALRAGATAVLPAGSFDLARQVLLALDADPAFVDFSIALSQGLWPAGNTCLPEA